MYKLIKTFKKYVIISLVVALIISLKVFADVGPGEGIIVDSVWGIQSDYIGSSPIFWCKWAVMHYGEGTRGDSKVGDETGARIIYVDRTEGRADSEEAYGYGLYQMDLKKHMAGYLYYLSGRSNSEIRDNISMQGCDAENLFTEEKKEKGVITTKYISLKSGCELVAKKLMSTVYSENIVNAYLNPLLDHINNTLGYEKVKDLQSNFWYKVYGREAYSLLSALDFNIPKDEEIVKKVKGAVLSIMEDRYRNKTLPKKSSMYLKIAKGDLWPFLVYTTTEDKGVTTKWEYETIDNKIALTDWEKMLTGAYQYMCYYEYKVEEDADSTDKKNIYNACKAEMFENEYYALFGKKLPKLEGEELEDFYRKIRNIRRYYKKRKDNAGGIFGEEELYDISSESSYSNAITSLKNKINSKEYKEAFKYIKKKEYVARTYLMAKNIANNTRLIEQNAQYNIGTNIMRRTPGGFDNEILLSDMQLITLSRDQNSGAYTADADKDGILDGKELGSDEGTYKEVDITIFVKQMLKAEAGDDEVLLESLLTEYKNNVNIANADKKKVNEIEAKHSLRVENDKIKIDLMTYRSNPILKDTDFDGVWDGYGYKEEKTSDGVTKEVAVNLNAPKDKKPFDNSIKGNIKMSNGDVASISSHMDYRYFFMDKTNYYDELAEMSLILSNAVSERDRNNLSNIDKINEIIGINLTKRHINEGSVPTYKYIYSKDYAIGHKEVEYSKDNSNENYIKKLIIPVIIPSMDRMFESESYSEIGSSNWVEKERCKDQGEESHHIKSYEIYAESIKYNIDEYIRLNSIDIGSYDDIVYWVTGYKEGGAIANILAAKLIDMSETVYCYTFGSPNTIYNGDDEEGKIVQGNRARYESIFNVVNEADAYSFIMPQSLGFSRYGQMCYGKVLNTSRYEQTEAIVKGIESIYKGSENKVRDKTYADGIKIREMYKDLMEAIEGERNGVIMGGYLNKYYNKYGSNVLFEPLVNSLRENYNKVKKAGNEYQYYIISKNMRNEDIQDSVNFYKNKNVAIKSNENAGTAIEPYLDKMGKWYVDNVYTYQVGSYGAKRYRTIYVPVANKNDPLGYIFRINKDIISVDNIKGDIVPVDNTYNKVEERNAKYYKVTYEQEISLEEAKEGKLRKGTVQMSEDQVTYYDYERYQVEFKSRFNEHLNMCGEEAREKREEELTKKGVNPEEIYRYDKRADGKFFFDVDDYIQQETVKRTKGIARGKYKYTNKEKSMELEVADDCSGFAEAVFLTFIKDHKFEGADKEKALWYGSSAYVDGTALKKLEKYGFKCYKVSSNKNAANDEKDSLQYLLSHGGFQYGDLVCANGHVEFYRDENHTFGWGNTHNSYEDNEGYDWVWSDTENCLYDKKLEKEDGTVSLSKSDKYVAVYRYIGGK